LDIKQKNSQTTQGKLVIRGDNMKDCNEFVFFKLQGIKLLNTDGWFDKSDPFVRVSKIREDKTIQKIYESEFIKDNLNPSWKPFEVSVGRLCDGDHNKLFKYLRTMDHLLRIEVWDWEKSGKSKFIGEKDLSLNQLKGEKEFDLINHKEKKPGRIRFD
jgi:Ca2+-dependent lipid-binding protein